MEDQCLSLTWNNHGATYRQTLSLLREENTLTDVTLACDGQKFAAHKLVLVTCSDYFRTILGDVPCQHPIVYLRGVAAKEMQALIDFMYTGHTDIPQKEVPTLLSTAEALQIKGLGVYNSDDNDSRKSNAPKRDKGSGHKKKRSEPLVLLNGTSDENVNITNSQLSPSKGDQYLENLYSHHYAFKSPPKRRRIDDKTVLKPSEYTSNLETDKVTPKESSSSAKEKLQDNLTLQVPGPQSDIFQHSIQPPPMPTSSSYSTSYSSSVPTDAHSDSPHPETQNNLNTTSQHTKPRTLTVSQNCSLQSQQSVPETQNNLNTTSQYTKPRSLPSRQNTSVQSQLSVHNPRCEANTTSPRALNYSLSGLGGNMEDQSSGSQPLEESNTNIGDTPENLMKSEIKEEALDFSNTSFNDSLYGDTITAALAANKFEEETKMYLNAFAQSANLVRPQLQEDTQETAVADDRPFVCPICRKCFAKAAILKRHHLAHFRPYVCHLCTRSFTRREVLAEHLLEHNGADLRMPCPVCNMTIKRKRNLQAHIKVKHPEYYQQRIESKKSVC